jgi:signal peptidase II
MSGYVVDFLDFSFPWIKTEMFPYGYHWPSFNVADSCVCIAAALFIISSFFVKNEEGKKA